MNPLRPNSLNSSRPERMGTVFYFKTALSSLSPEIQEIAAKDASTLTAEEIEKVRRYQKRVPFFYDMAVSKTVKWANKPGKKELARAAKRVAARAEQE